MSSSEQITRTTGPLIDGLLIAHRLRRTAAARLLLCRVAANRMHRYHAEPADIHAIPHFECQSCHCDSLHSSALQGSANDLERAAQTALMRSRRWAITT